MSAPSGSPGASPSTRAAVALGAVEAASGARLAWIAVQLVGIGVLLRLLHVESEAFQTRVVPLAIGGAVVHHFLPLRHRLTFFALLSLAAIWLVFGVAEGTWLIGLGMGLIALCHLPAPFGVRVALLLAAGAVLAAMRVDLVPTPFSTAVWAILGSMFMFRTILYVHALRHATRRTTWDERLAYFFCLPNVAFPLFPVLDFATFRRTYYDRAAPEIYEQGLRWMARGLTHLVLYRAVYQFGLVDSTEVVTGTRLVQQVLATYALYLRVSGQFHLIVGLLHLFGFRLPETHRFFYLASSFSDLWNRINIYWKDFMQKVFYLPVFLRLTRRRGETVALVASTVVVFVATWLLHSYQWFWVLGTWHVSTPDSLFWSILALCLIANQLWSARHPRARTLGVPRLTTRQLAAHGAQTAAMFAFMSVLWTLWSSPSLGEFRALFTHVTFGWRDAAVVGAVLATVALVAMATFRHSHARALGAGHVPSYRPMFASLGVLCAVVVASMPAAERLVSTPVHDAAVNLREGRLNAQDLALQRRGYYEAINDASRANAEILRLNLWAGRARNEGEPRAVAVLKRVNDARVRVVRPNLNQDEMGTRLRTNAWGMRDLPYPLEKPAGTWRIALFGPSIVFGTGVNDDEVFEVLVEERLNLERPVAAGGPERFEILNFAVPASSLWQHLASTRLGYVERFAPDVLLFVGARNELWNAATYWQDVLRVGADGTMPELAALFATTGITAETHRDSTERLMAPVRDRILDLLYASIASEARRIGAIPAYGTIEVPLQRRDDSVTPLLQRAARAGIVTFDLSHVYRGRDERKLVLSESNAHPNAEGHRLIADALFRELVRRPALLGAPDAGGDVVR